MTITSHSESIRQGGPKSFSEIFPKLRQAGLVRLPDLGTVIIQSDVSTSEGKKARRIVRRKGRKKEDGSVDASQKSINNYFSTIEDSSKCTNGKRKAENYQTGIIKKRRLGHQTKDE